MTSRKAYRMVPKAGSFQRLKLVDESLPDPQAHEIQVAVKAFGLNFADIFAIYGLYSATPEGSFVPGLEYAGVVEKVGSDTSKFKVGDRVMGVTRFGAYASHLNIDERYLVALPTDWEFEDGAALLVQALTAYYALFNLGDLQPGQNVLVHSAAGGVGIHACRMVLKAGAHPIGTVGNASKINFLKQEGVEEVMVRAKDFGHQLEEVMGDRDLHLILDCIGGKVLKDGFDIMAPMGRMVVYGSAHYAAPGSRPNYLRLIWKYLNRPKIDPQNMTNLNKSVMAFNLIWLYEKAELMHELIEEIQNMGLPKPHIGHRFQMDQLHEALHLFLSGKTIGKLIVEVG